MHVGELTIVDAECCQAMAEAFNDFGMLRAALQGAGEPAAGAGKVRESVMEYTERLDRDVVALVGSGQKHLSPVQTWRNKRRREEARKRLDAGRLT